MLQTNRVALITGAGRRIGATIARYLHTAGFSVAIHCHRSVNDAQRLADELNQLRVDSALVLQADLQQLAALPALFNQLLAWREQLDVLVNNASLFLRTALPAIDPVAAEAMWLTNVQAPFYLSALAYPTLAAVQGCIINLTDVHATKALKGYSDYCQTKAALAMQTISLAREYAPLVRVNAVAPGAIAWPEASNALTVAQQAKIIAKTPLQCHGSPEWVAQAVLSLIDNPFITGQTVSVDGGRSLV